MSDEEVDVDHGEDLEVDELPKYIRFLLEIGLYEEFDLVGDYGYIRGMFIGPDIQFDAHCIYCKKDSTFKQWSGSRGSGAGSTPARNSYWLEQRVFTLEFHCQRDDSHEYYYTFRVDRQAVSKIGQSPSLATIASSDTARFRKVLDKNYFSDLNRAIGLFSHGIGAGSFVYLRRIFEHLLIDASKIASKEGKLVEGFDKLHIDEKVKALKSYLPEEVIESAGVYGVLSAGIHSLSEEECKSLFPIMRASIEFILDGHLAERKREEHKLELKRAMNEAVSKVRAQATTSNKQE